MKSFFIRFFSIFLPLRRGPSTVHRALPPWEGVGGRPPCTLLFLFLLSCTSQPYTDGERLYQANCANCHLDDGKGLGALIPPLAGSDHLAAQAGRLPCIIRYGLSDTIVVNGKTYAELMPGVPALSDIEVTNLSNYVLHRWSPGRRPFSLEEGRAVLEKCRR